MIESKKTDVIKVTESDGRLTTLRPVWISNGTFFGVHPLPGKHDPAEILGPVLHQGEVMADVTPSLVTRSVPKSERWMIAQPRGEDAYGRVNIIRNHPRQSVIDFISSQEEVLGGAGLLISEGQAHTRSFWASPSGGDFDTAPNSAYDPQMYSTGSVVARCSGVNPIYYAIYITGEATGKNPGRHIHWSESASYLSSEQFRSDLAKKRKVKDSPIQEACVFDGGSSRQLWVRGAPTPLRFTGVEVPNHLCVWGHIE